MPWTPTDADLLGLVGVGQRIDGFAFDLLDSAEVLLGQLHPSRDSVPSVSNDATRTVRRQLSNMLLTPDEAADIDPLTVRVRPRMLLQNGSTYPLGVFLLGDRNTPVHSWGDDRSVTWSDKSMLLAEPITHSVGWGIGADVALAIVGLALEVLTLADLGPAPTSDVVFGAPVAYPPGTSRLTIIEDFAKLLGWLPPFFDELGLLRFVEVPDMAAAIPDVPGYGPGTRIVADSILESDNLLQAPNQFIVVEASGRSTIRGVYNVSDAAPHSFVNTGRLIPHIEQVQGLSTTTQANRAARALAATARKGIFKFVTFDGTADPRHGTWSVVPYRRTVADAYINHLELSTTIGCRSGAPMSHQLRRVF